MRKLPSLIIIGTDTGVGKTVVTALLTKIYQQRGVSVSPFKPVATGAVKSSAEYIIKQKKKPTPSKLIWPDTEFLAQASGLDESLVSLYKFKAPLSPHLAAAKENCFINTTKIKAKLIKLQAKYEAVLVEGVGGLMVPLNKNSLLLDLIEALNLPVVIVSRASLGTLNHTLLTVQACRERNIQIAGLVVNCFNKNVALTKVDQPRLSEVEKLNLKELPRLTKVPLLGVLPPIPDLNVDTVNLGQLASYLKTIDINKLSLKKETYRQAIKADLKYVWHPFTPMTEYLAEKPYPLMIVKAKGNYLIAADGKQYLDGVSSLWVNIHGHCHPQLDQAIKKQLNQVAHSTLLGLANKPASLLAEKLVKIAPPSLNKVFYSDNGSTAVEIGLKVAYQYWQQKGFPQKKEFISFVNAYHGDTIGAVSLGGIDLFHRKFQPLLFKTHLVPAAYCYRCPVSLSYPSCSLACLNQFTEVLTKNCEKLAAVVVEPKVQGAAGILTQPPGYLKKIASLCQEHNVLLLADEVATGFGRTGKMFACEHENIAPDIMALAKGITGGYLPLAATLFKEEIYNAFLGPYEEEKTFFHGHTYTGNPLGAAVALANLKLFAENQVIKKLQPKIKLFKELLQPLVELKYVGDVRQIGLMAGIELVQNKKSKEPFPVKQRVGRQVIIKARERGVIIRPLGDVIVLMPPLSISAQELKKLVQVTMWAIKEITGA